MWLINVETLKLQEFGDDQVVPYDILSHTWSDDEVSFEDMQQGTAEGLKGYDKIIKACKAESSNHCMWMWIDTCCIDKTSSAHLSEAINSMYRYYKQAAVCIVYLADLDAGSNGHDLSNLKNCRWFKRSWTLQELIAPKNVVFYDKTWKMVGDRRQLLDILSDITRINKEALISTHDLSNFSVARKMSWAAGRQATRKEDIAYSLLGIFDVHMPLLYGEGNRAFVRLQEEIMKQSDDQSIFAWGTPRDTDLKSEGDIRKFLRLEVEEVFSDIGTESFMWPTFRGLDEIGFLADSPDMFKDSAHVVAYSTDQDEVWTMTNKGVQVHFPSIPSSAHTLFLLNCHWGTDIKRRFAIVTRSVPGNLRNRAPGSLCVVDETDLERAQKRVERRRYFLVKDNSMNRMQSDGRKGGILLEIKSRGEWIVSEARPVDQWQSDRMMFVPPTKQTKTWRTGVRIEAVRRSLYTEQEFYVNVVVGRGVAGCLVSTERQIWEAVLEDGYCVRPQKGPKTEYPSHLGLMTTSRKQDEEGHELRLDVTKKDIMGQEMFVVNVVEIDHWMNRDFWQVGSEQMGRFGKLSAKYFVLAMKGLREYVP